MFSRERYRRCARARAVDRTATRPAAADAARIARSYLQGLLTNDIAALTPGTGCYAALLTAQGRMMADMRVLELGDRLLLDRAGDGQRRRPRPPRPVHLQRGRPGRGRHRRPSPARRLRSRRGATCVGAALDAVSEDAAVRRSARVPTVEPLAGVDAGRSSAATTSACRLRPVRRRAAGGALTAALLARRRGRRRRRGRPKTLRIESGRPRLRHATWTTTRFRSKPGIEERAISLTKGCYVGQEVIVRVLHRGHGRVAKRLVGLTFDAGSAAPAGRRAGSAAGREIGTRDERDVGRRALARPIALGYVHRDSSSRDTHVDRRRRTPAAVDARCRSSVASRIARPSSAISSSSAGGNSSDFSSLAAPSASPDRAAAPVRPSSSQRKKCSSTARSG